MTLPHDRTRLAGRAVSSLRTATNHATVKAAKPLCFGRTQAKVSKIKKGVSMVDVSELAVEKCFVTATNQMRKIFELSDGKVTYESWSANQARPTNPHRVTVNEAKFCADVDRSIDCNHQEGFGGT